MDNWKKLCYVAVGVIAGAATTYLVLRFPGGRGEERRLDLCFRESAEYRVKRVVDGDTIVIEPGMYVRYAGVSAPETRQVVEFHQPFGQESTEANRKLVEGQRVKLRFSDPKMDRYGRILANVLVREPESGEWKDVGEDLARCGLVRPAYRSDGSPNREQVIRASADARARKIGVWKRSPRSRKR
jgi:micrococcal nuclease